MKLKFKFTSIFVAAVITASLIVPVTASAAGERPTITIGRFNTPPTIDGSFSEAEWGTKSFIIAENQPNITVYREKTKDADGKEVEKPIEKSTADVYLGYDDTHLYLCVVADYANHKAMALLGSQLWAEDCIQTKIAATPDGPNYNDIDFGLNVDTNRALGHVWNGHGVTYSALRAGKGKDFMITRTGQKTVYEIAYPLASFATNTLKLKQGDKLAFSIAQHMSGGGFYEFADGIVLSKEISGAGILVLGKDKDISSNGNNTTTSSKPSGNGNNTTITSIKPSGNGNVTSGNTQSRTQSTVQSGKQSDVSNPENGDGTNSGIPEITGGPGSASTGAGDTNDGNNNNTSAVAVNEEPSDGIPIGWIIGVAVAVVAILGVAFYFLIIRKK